MFTAGDVSNIYNNTLASPFSTQCNSVTNNGSNLWVAVGSGTNNTIGYSTLTTPTIAWTGIGTSIFSVSGNSIVWTGSTFFAAGQGSANTLAYSSNGTQWTGLGTTIYRSIGTSVAIGSNNLITLTMADQLLLQLKME